MPARGSNSYEHARGILAALFICESRWLGGGSDPGEALDFRTIYLTGGQKLFINVISESKLVRARKLGEKLRKIVARADERSFSDQNKHVSRAFYSHK